MHHLAQLQQLIRCCHELAAAGYAPASGGNASIFTPEGVWITKRGTALKALTVDDFVLVNQQGEVIGNEGIPSKEGFLHLAVYHSRPEDRAIIHLHPPQSIAACSLVNEDGSNPLPAMVPSYIMRIRGTVLLPYYPPGDPQLAGHIREVARDNQIIYLRNHGIVSAGQTVTQAMQAVEEAEENARIFLLTRGQGQPISREDCEALQRNYWGEVYKG